MLIIFNTSVLWIFYSITDGIRLLYYADLEYMEGSQPSGQQFGEFESCEQLVYAF